MKGRWAKDSCPFAKDQGFDAVVGDVKPGEVIFGFTHTLSGGSDELTIKTETGGKVTEMADLLYRVFAVRVDAASEVALYNIRAKTKTGFILDGDGNHDYDVVVVGRVLY